MKQNSLQRAYVEVAHVAEKRGSVLQKGIQFLGENVASRCQGVPISPTGRMEVHDKVENVRAFSGHLPQDDSASVPGRPRHVVRIELFVGSQSIENRLDLELVDHGTRQGSIGASRWSHFAQRTCVTYELKMFWLRWVLDLR